VTVDANADKVHKNHESKLVAELRASCANLTIVAVTYKSKVDKEWLSRSGVDHWQVLNTKVNDRKMTPNQLIRLAYTFVLSLPVQFDTLVSVRCDIMLKQSFAGQLSRALDLDRVGFPWKEVNARMPKPCSFRTSGFSSSCEGPWLQNGERFADSMIVAPKRMIPDLRFAVVEAMRYKVKWDQHSMFQHLKKHRGYTIDDNVSTMIPGYWNSNPNAHSNPLFSLARRKRMDHRRGGHHRR